MKANDISRCKCISSRIIHNNMLESLTTIFSIAVNARLHTRPFECVRRKCFIFIERCVDVLVCYGFVSIELACIRIACVFPITVVILLLFFFNFIAAVVVVIVVVFSFYFLLLSFSSRDRFNFLPIFFS